MKTKNTNTAAEKKETLKKTWAEPTLIVVSKDLILTPKGVFTAETGTSRRVS